MIKNAIEIKKLHKIYDNQFEALKSIDLESTIRFKYT